MKRPTFIEGAAFAFAVSVIGSVLYPMLSWALPGGTVLRLVIAGISLAYVVYLLSRSNERIGRVTTLAVWALAAVAAWVIAPSIVLYVLLHLGLVWFIRSLYFYSSVLSALADMGLNGLSLAAAVWAMSWTGSVFLSLWCFFLTQALFVFVPHSLQRKPGTGRQATHSEDRFDVGHRAAEAAVRKLSTH